jgi:hypothetical protein
VYVGAVADALTLAKTVMRGERSLRTRVTVLDTEGRKLRDAVFLFFQSASDFNAAAAAGAGAGAGAAGAGGASKKRGRDGAPVAPPKRIASECPCVCARASCASFVVRRASCIVHRASCIVHRALCIVHRAPCG